MFTFVFRALEQIAEEQKRTRRIPRQRNRTPKKVNKSVNNASGRSKSPYKPLDITYDTTNSSRLSNNRYAKANVK